MKSRVSIAVPYMCAVVLAVWPSSFLLECMRPVREHEMTALAADDEPRSALRYLTLVRLIADVPAWPKVPFFSIVDPPEGFDVEQWETEAAKYPREDFSPEQWQQLLRCAFVLQRTDPDDVQTALLIFKALIGSGVYQPGDAQSTKPMLLFRLMFDLDAEPKGQLPDWLRACDGLQWVSLDGERSGGEAPLSTPVEWTADGPALWAVHLKSLTPWIAEPNIVFHHLRRNFEYRPNLKRFIQTDCDEWRWLVRNGYLGIEHWPGGDWIEDHEDLENVEIDMDERSD